MCKQRVTKPSFPATTCISVSNPFAHPFNLNRTPPPAAAVSLKAFKFVYFLNRLFVFFPIHYPPTSLSLLQQRIFIAPSVVTWFPSHEIARIQPKKRKK